MRRYSLPYSVLHDPTIPRTARNLEPKQLRYEKQSNSGCGRLIPDGMHLEESVADGTIIKCIEGLLGRDDPP